VVVMVLDGMLLTGNHHLDPEDLVVQVVQVVVQVTTNQPAPELQQVA
tara:strand:- start:486 stop:626 length:141 start_codon:yes stop_codon:yes gene_type:complete